MAKHPAPGRVKTRLAAALGDAFACALARAFIVDLAARLAQLPYRTTWAYWPPTASFATLLPGARCRPQRGADLGARMATAVAQELAEGAGGVVVLGADSPHVPTANVDEAARALVAGTELVLGPAIDGGYYLIGVRRAQPELFTGIAWGTAEVLVATLAHARALGLATHLLEPGFDVDDPADLTRLRLLLARGDVHLPATADVLAAGRGHFGP